jgi:hypothetical protein
MFEATTLMLGIVIGTVVLMVVGADAYAWATNIQPIEPSNWNNLKITLWMGVLIVIYCAFNFYSLNKNKK